MRGRHRDPQASDLELEIERLRRALADKDRQIHRQAEEIAKQQQQIADAEKQIPNLERQLALRNRTPPTHPSRLPPMDWQVSRARGAGERSLA